MEQRGDLCYKDILTDRLLAGLRQAARSRTSQAPSLLRLEVDVEGLAPADWLAARRRPVKTYWANRDGDFEAAGAGLADVLTDQTGLSPADALTEIRRRIAAADGPVRYYGGICFDPDDPRDPWPEFGRFRFVVPKVEVRRQRGDTTLAVNIRRTADATVDTLQEEILRIVDDLAHAPDSPPLEQTTILSRTDEPDRSDWTAMVNDTLADLAAGRIDKLVLARRAVLQTSSPLNPLVLLDRIAPCASAYRFCFQVQPRSVFFGASPECLFTCRGDEIASEAVAGTALTGATDAECRRHRSLLSESAKDSEEHEWVFQGVRSGLGQICDQVRVVDQRQIVSLGYVQHFRSRFVGRLRPGIATADILAALHPTAAVNGHPRKTALQHLRSREPFARGWYAGPVGWIGADASEFAVAIRSARVLGDQVSLFAGAGIVSGSDPDGEWAETASKLSLFLNALV